MQLQRPENQDKLITAAASDAVPDVIMLMQDHIPIFGPARKVLLPLDEVVERERLNPAQVFYETDATSCQLDGKTWELPHTLPTSAVMVHFNKDIALRAGLDFEKAPPQTWDELLAAAQKLTLRDGDAVAQLGADLAPSPTFFDVYAGTVRGAAFSADLKKATFNEPAALDAIEWLLRARQSLGGRAAVSAFQQSFQGQLLFPQARKLALAHGHYGNYFEWSNNFPDFKSGFGAFAVPPRQRGAEMALPHRAAWGWGICAASKVRDAAWPLLKKFTVDADGGGWLQVQQGRPSPIRKVQESGEFRAMNPYWKEVEKTVEGRWKRPASLVPPDADAAWKEVVTRIEREEVAPRAALTDGVTLVQGLLNRS